MKILLFLLILIIGLCGTIMAQAERIIYENFKPLSNEISFDLPGEIEIKYWNKDDIRVLTVIKSENCDRETLSALIDLGRYSLKYAVLNDFYQFKMSNTSDDSLILGGNTIKASLKFEVRLPEGMIVKEKEKN
jgi:hypothetical protein